MVEPLYLARAFPFGQRHHLVTCQMRQLVLAFLSSAGDPSWHRRYFRAHGNAVRQVPPADYK